MCCSRIIVQPAWPGWKEGGGKSPGGQARKVTWATSLGPCRLCCGFGFYSASNRKCGKVNKYSILKWIARRCSGCQGLVGRGHGK